MKQLITLLALCATTVGSTQTFTTYTMADGMPSDNIRDVAIAPNGWVWLATQQGVAKYNGSTFDVYNMATYPGLASNDVNAIAVINNMNVWAGTDFGASHFDGSMFTTYTTADGLSDNEIKNIKVAPNGDVWFATINGATRYSGGIFTAFGSPGIPFGGAQHIAFAANGDVYLSGGLGGIIIYDGTSFSSLTTADGLISNRVRSIAIDGAQNKWVATAEGISIFDASNSHVGDHTRAFILPAPDTLNPVTDVAFDSNGHVWAGVYVDYLVTEGGISAYNGNSWTQYETTDGLAGPNVRRIAIDGSDDVWVSTSTGLTRISDTTIGIDEVTSFPNFSLYPNPASSAIFIDLQLSSMAYSGFELYDAQFRLLRTEAITTSRMQVDISALQAGIYFMKMGETLQKFIVE